MKSLKDDPKDKKTKKCKVNAVVTQARRRERGSTITD